MKYIFGLFLLIVLYQCQLMSRMKNLNQKELPSIKNSIGMELLEVPSGDFQMGCSNGDSSCDDDEIPQRNIEINKSFYLGKYEVTKLEFSKFVAEKKYNTDAERSGFTNTWRNCQAIKQQDNHPVICVSWNDAVEFAKWISAKENKKYRLPREAEWEYAARANHFTRYYWGTDMEESDAWFNKNSEKSTQIVGTKKPNSWGFYDITGNVSEWCEDTYDPNYFKKKEKGISFPNGNVKVLRGGSWFDSFLMLRVSARAFAPKETHENNFGFRILLEK